MVMIAVEPAGNEALRRTRIQLIPDAKTAALEWGYSQPQPGADRKSLPMDGPHIPERPRATRIGRIFEYGYGFQAHELLPADHRVVSPGQAMDGSNS